MKRGTKWTADEDAKLVAGLKADKKPKDIEIPGRTPRSIEERWKLARSLNGRKGRSKSTCSPALLEYAKTVDRGKCPWTEEDDKKLIDLLNEHLEIGGLTKQSYVEIGTKLQRTPNAVAQRWSNARTGNSRAGRISEALSSFADDVLFRQLAMQSRPLDGQRMTREAAKAAVKVAEVHAFKEAAPFDPTSDSGNANEKVWHPLDQKVKDAFFITVEHLEQASARKRRNTNGLVFRLKGLHNTYERDLLHELGEIFGFGVTMEMKKVLVYLSPPGHDTGGCRGLPWHDDPFAVVPPPATWTRLIFCATDGVKAFLVRTTGETPFVWHSKEVIAVSRETLMYDEESRLKHCSFMIGATYAVNGIVDVNLPLPVVVAGLQSQALVSAEESPRAAVDQDRQDRFRQLLLALYETTQASL